MDIKQLTHTAVLELLPDRSPTAHKGDFGKILMLCGSCGYTGAPALAAMGALRSGAGLVYLGVPESIYAIEAVKLTEPIVFPLPDENGGFSQMAVEPIHNMLPKMDAVLIGPGIGCNNGSVELVMAVLRTFSGPVVLDADGINVLNGHIDVLRGRTGPTILTPHAGEFARVGGVLTGDRITDAVNFAEKCNAVIVLKGHGTVITDALDVYVNPTGNPGMAVGGSGDVLAGIIVSLIGQGIPILDAAAAGAWLHGAAGDLCAAEIGQYGILPTDMLQVLPRLMK